MCHAQEVLSISLNTVTHLVRREREREGRRETVIARPEKKERDGVTSIQLEGFAGCSTMVGPPGGRTDPTSV